MKIKGLVDEDFVNYKKPSMYIAFPRCSFKCDKECGRQVCQNSALANEKNIDVGIKTIINRYINNPITKAVVCGGLEPFDSWEDLQQLITYLRIRTNDDIVVYTGYYEEEIEDDKIKWLMSYGPIIVKYGRFIPDDEEYFNEELGVKLASKNQYTVRYMNENNSKSK